MQNQRRNYVNELGKKYFKIISKGTGLTPETRNKKQIKTINEILTRTQPLIKNLSNKIINSHPYFKNKIDSEDLNNEQSYVALLKFNKYNSTKGSVSTFIYLLRHIAIQNVTTLSLYPFHIPKSSRKKKKIEIIYFKTNPKTNEIEPDIIDTSIEINPIKKAEQKNIEEIIKETIKKIKLNPLEKNIITLKFGLYENKEHTFDEIGKIHKVSKQRIHQKYANIIKKLKKNIQKEYKSDDFL